MDQVTPEPAPSTFGRWIGPLLFVGVAAALTLLAWARLQPPPAGDEKVAWVTDPAAATTAAEAADGVVLIEFTSQRCGYCQKMKRDVYTDDSVAAAIAQHRVTPLRVDVLADRSQPLVAAYRVSALPTFFLATPDGQVIDSRMGYMAADEFTEWIATRAPARSTATAQR